MLLEYDCTYTAVYALLTSTVQATQPGFFLAVTGLVTNKHEFSASGATLRLESIIDVLPTGRRVGGEPHLAPLPSPRSCSLATLASTRACDGAGLPHPALQSARLARPPRVGAEHRAPSVRV